MDQKRTFVTLDGLRGIAAIAVLLRHTVPNFMPTSPSASGYLAVDLFFVLSGFVIAYAYERALLNGLTITQFMIKRVVRLYPLYIVAGLVSLVFLTIRLFIKHQGMSEEGVYIANLFYIPIPINLNTELHVYPLNDPAWSLGLEILINAVFAALILPLQRSVVLAATIAAGAVLLTVCVVLNGSADVGPEWPTVLGGIGRVTFSFFAGVAIYRFRSRFSLKLPSFAPYLAALALAGLMCVDVAGPWRMAYDLVTVLMIFPALVYVSSFCEPKGVGAAVMAFIGAISYSLYVWQMPIIQAFQFVMKARHLQPSFVLSTAFFITVFAVAIGFNYFYDGPVRQRITDWLKYRRAAPAQAD